MMDDIGIHNQIGKLIIEMKYIIEKLSCLEMADIDTNDLNDYENEIENVKDLIVKSRNVIDDDYFEFIIGEN